MAWVALEKHAPGILAAPAPAAAAAATAGATAPFNFRRISKRIPFQFPSDPKGTSNYCPKEKLSISKGFLFQKSNVRGAVVGINECFSFWCS